jgi:hypothetical protein
MLVTLAPIAAIHRVKAPHAGSPPRPDRPALRYARSRVVVVVVLVIPR